MILIKDGRVVDPASGIDEALDVVIDNGTIKTLGKFPKSDEYERIIDAKGKIVAPGLVDIHVHFRDPGLTYKEDIVTGAAAAAAGGFTTVVCMANTKPVVDSVETLSELLGRMKQLPIHVLSAAAVTKGFQGKEITDMRSLRAAGAAGFTDDGIPITDSGVLFAAMQLAKELDVPISLHEEDPALIASPGINQGAISRQLGVGGAPALAEESLVARDCMLALRSGAKVDIQHISSGVSVDVVRSMKKLGASVYAEVTPQHFSLTEQAALERGALAKVNPPLRTEADRYALIRGLKDGTIDFIATDHAPHSREEKSRGLEKSAMGVVGLETAFSVLYTHLVRPGLLPMDRLIALMHDNPARRFGFGTPLAAGQPADLTVFDLDAAYTVDPEKFLSMGRATPFAGMDLYGVCRMTMIDGNIVWQEGEA